MGDQKAPEIAREIVADYEQQCKRIRVPYSDWLTQRIQWAMGPLVAERDRARAELSKAHLGAWLILIVLAALGLVTEKIL